MNKQIESLQQEIKRNKSIIQLQIALEHIKQQQEHTKQLGLLIEIIKLLGNFDSSVSVNFMALIEIIFGNNSTKTKHQDYNTQNVSNHEDTKANIINKMNDLMQLSVPHCSDDWNDQ